MSEAKRYNANAVQTGRPPEWRVTRPGQYVSPGCPGHTDPGARQGYYIRAWSAEEAVLQMARVHKADVEFDVQPWGHNSLERAAQIRYLDAKAAVAAVRASEE